MNCKRKNPSSGKPPVGSGAVPVSAARSADETSLLRPLVIERCVYEQIRQQIGSRRAEEGGPLGGSRQTGIVSDFYHDDSARRSVASYSPNHVFLNKLFKEQWNPQEINLLGFVHSHPPGVRHPSAGDEFYAEQILKYIPELDRLLMPIVMTVPNTGSFEFLPFVAYRKGRGVEIEPVELIIEDRDVTGIANNRHPDASVELPKPVEISNSAEIWQRVRNAYDQARLQRSRVVVIGTGGSAGFIEDLARTGVQQFVLIDGDTVSPPNLATQQTYRTHIGRPKVEGLASRIIDINPDAYVLPQARMLDEIGDPEMEHILRGEINGTTPDFTLLCGFTDDFYAQARIHRLALQFATPCICAQMYRQGRGAEITFTYSGVTAACHRCASARRYKAYLQENFENTVTSEGTPIFSTTRLNSVCGFVAMAILHHGSDHPRFGGLLARIGDRNLIQIRMDPDFAETLGLSSFDRVLNGADSDRLCFDETIWLPQKPDNPENGFPTCPDCGGTGNLRDAAGTFDDTRVMRQ